VIIQVQGGLATEDRDALLGSRTKSSERLLPWRRLLLRLGEDLTRKLGGAGRLGHRPSKLGVELGKVVVGVDQVERVCAKDGGLGGRRLLRSSGLRLESLLRLEGLLRLLLHWLRLETLLCWLSLSVLQLPQLHKAWECPWLLLLLLRLEALLLDWCCLLEGLGRPWLLHRLRLELLEGLLLHRLLLLAGLEGLHGSESLLSRGSWLLEGLLGRLNPLREPLGRHRGRKGSPRGRCLCWSWSSCRH